MSSTPTPSFLIVNQSPDEGERAPWVPETLYSQIGSRLRMHLLLVYRSGDDPRIVYSTIARRCRTDRAAAIETESLCVPKPVALSGINMSRVALLRHTPC
jgi:hypothetical protein